MMPTLYNVQILKQCKWFMDYSIYGNSLKSIMTCILNDMMSLNVLTAWVAVLAMGIYTVFQSVSFRRPSQVPSPLPLQLLQWMDLLR